MHTRQDKLELIVEVTNIMLTGRHCERELCFCDMLIVHFDGFSKPIPQDDNTWLT